MKKAKTKRNYISILSAILGVVFAFITGVTYCFNLLTFNYGTNQNSTSAYLGNQQYVMINDTIDCPVAFGDGSHNIEIAMQYAMSYDFDVRLKYSLSWSNGANADNVILHFANRDNVIYDKEYIYLANSIPAGEGKISFITGVNFVDTKDKRYYGQSLTINIVSEKIYKEQEKYDDSHKLYADAFYSQTSQISYAAQMWLASKPKTEDYAKTIDLNQANVLMYNQRNNYENGIPYPGHNTAYKRNVVSTTVGESVVNKTTSATWLGGNRSYAGTGMYVVTGAKAIKLKVKVEGIWYSSPNEIDSSDLISENSIKYHYSEGWTNEGWFNNKLWEIRSFDYVIPANTSCYVDILESIEITSASKNQDTLAYDKYRMVTNRITINAGDQDLLFDYTADQNKIRKSELSVDTVNEITGSTYSKKDVEIINTSLYSQGLYETRTSNAQSFNTNVSLINNTAETKTVALTYQLYYHLSNGSTGFIDTNGNRAEEYVNNGTWTDETAFTNNLCYGYDVAATSNRLTSAVKNTVVVGPYASVKLIDNYRVSADLRSDIESKSGNTTTHYDVWTYVDVAVAKSEGKDLIQNTPVPTTANLEIQTEVSGNTVTLSVKNNTTETLSGITISSFSIAEMTSVDPNLAENYTALTDRPSDWVASYWKYYKIDENGKFVQLTSDPLAEQGENAFPTVPTYYEKRQEAYSTETSVITLTPALHFSKTGTTITADNTITLKHGESIVFATAKTTQTSHVVVNGNASASSVVTPSSLMIINSGKTSAYLINHTSNSYFVRFSGTISSDAKFEVGNVTVGDTQYTHNYYIGVVRPGQIIPVSMLAKGDLTASDMVLVGDYFDADALTGANWSPEIIEILSKYFALIKTTN